MGMNAQRQLKNDVVTRKLVSELSKCYPHRLFISRERRPPWRAQQNIPIAAEEPKPRLEAVELARLVLSERVIPRKKNHLTGREGQDGCGRVGCDDDADGTVKGHRTQTRPNSVVQ